MLPDDLFEAGELKHLVAGNDCRLLDKRRTPGSIVSLDLDGGFFRWEISDFEDCGKFWDVPFENIDTYQFRKGSAELTSDQLQPITSRIESLAKFIEVKANEDEAVITQKNIEAVVLEAADWLSAKSSFFKNSAKLEFQSLTGPKLVREDFNRYISDFGLSAIEAKTAEIQVMNPQSGDWICATQIVMAEMGLKDYRGRQVRSSTAFENLGSKENRRKYIEHRLGFIRAFFQKLDIEEVTLYRGMSTEWGWQTEGDENHRFWLSWTFNYNVAQDFSDFKYDSKQKNSYLIKRAIPVNKLFMTFIETDAMNGQYLEAEAIVIHSPEDQSLW